MARITLIDADADPTLHDLAERIKGQRRGSVINVYKALLHNPALAESWFQHINAVRWGTELGGRLREILIIRVAHLTGCAYILRQHAAGLAEAEGLPQGQCDALANWRETPHFTAPERAALAFADAMTERIEVPDGVFAPLGEHFSERQILELAVLIASYNMHARVLRALEVDLEPG